MSLGLLDYRTDAPINWVSPVNVLHPLNRGLVGWWLCVPGAMGGSKWLDLCRKNNGTLTNMSPVADWVGTSRFGGWGSLDFDGSDDGVPVGNISSTLFSADSTIAFWLYARVLSGTTIYLDKRSSGSSGFLLRTNGSTVGSRWSNIADDLAAGVVPLNAWTHVAVTRHSGTVKHYINGAASASTGSTAVDASNTNQAVIGSRSFTSQANSANGLMDDMRIHDRALSELEVQRLVNQSMRGYPGLLNRVRFGRFAPAAAAGTILPHMMHLCS